MMQKFVQHPVVRRIGRVLYLVLRVYILLIVAVYFLQDYMLYQPPTYTEARARELAASYRLKSWEGPGLASGTGATAPGARSWENAAYVSVDPPTWPIRGTIIMAHGNAGSAIYSVIFADALTRLGFRVILYEYPGYGSNPGHPREETCVEPLRRLVRDAAAWPLPAGSGGGSPGGSNGKIYLFGQSMGCGVVCSALRDTTLPINGVILMQPWDSLAGAASYHFPFLPAGLMVGNKYNSKANLAGFTGPVAFVVCENDRTIPPVLSRRLYDSYPGRKSWLMLPGCDHNDWPADPELAWWKTVTDFVTAPAPAPTPVATPTHP